MKILKSFPSVSVVASPLAITQDIGQRSKISLESDLFCRDFMLVKLKLTGSATVGVDFLLLYEDLTQIPYRTLTTDEHLIELYLFNASNVLNFYLFPTNFSTYAKKEVEIHIVPEPRVYFPKIPRASVTLRASNSVPLHDFTTTPHNPNTGIVVPYNSSVDMALHDFTTTPHNPNTGVVVPYNSSVDMGESQLQVQSSYAVIEDSTHPTIQFESTSYNFGDAVVVTRSGDLSQNSVVKLYKSAVVIADAPDLYLIFAVGQSSISLPVSTLQMTSEFTLTLSPFTNSTIGLNSTTLIS